MICFRERFGTKIAHAPSLRRNAESPRLHGCPSPPLAVHLDEPCQHAGHGESPLNAVGSWPCLRLLPRVRHVHHTRVVTYSSAEPNNSAGTSGAARSLAIRRDRWVFLATLLGTRLGLKTSGRAASQKQCAFACLLATANKLFAGRCTWVHVQQNVAPGDRQVSSTTRQQHARVSTQ